MCEQSEASFQLIFRRRERNGRPLLVTAAWLNSSSDPRPSLQTEGNAVDQVAHCLFFGDSGRRLSGAGEGHVRRVYPVELDIFCIYLNAKYLSSVYESWYVACTEGAMPSSAISPVSFEARFGFESAMGVLCRQLPSYSDVEGRNMTTLMGGSLVEQRAALMRLGGQRFRRVCHRPPQWCRSKQKRLLAKGSRSTL
jgi:hypothetical protein